MSMPLSNSMEMTEVFSLEVEERCFKSGTALRVFSKVLEMLVSMSSALAPGYEVITMMKLVSISGNWLMERFIREYMPKMAIAMKTKAVVTGLLTAVRCKLIRI